MELLLVALHVMSNLVWIGAISCVGWLIRRAANCSDAAEGRTIAKLAYEFVYRRVATPAFAASFIFGVARLAMGADTYMHAHWFHGKLTFALAVIALHHVIGARARKAAAGSMQAGKAGAILTGALLSCAFMAVVFVVYQVQLVR